MSISSDVDSDSTKLASGNVSEHDSDVVMRIEDDVEAPDSVDLNGDVDMKRDGQKEVDEEEEDEKEGEVVDEDEEMDEDEDEDEDEDNGKEPQMIGQGLVVNTVADNTDTMVDDEPTMLPEHGQELHEHTPLPQPLVRAPRPQPPEPPPQPKTTVNNTVYRRERLERVTPQKPRPVAPTLREVEAAGNTSDVDVEQQLLGESAWANGLPNCTLPDLPLPDVPPTDIPLPDVPLANVPLTDVPLPEANLDGSVGEKWTSPCISEEACVWVRVVFLSWQFPLLIYIHLRHWVSHAWRCFVR